MDIYHGVFVALYWVVELEIPYIHCRVFGVDCENIY